ncbi:hypothetical protein HNP37_000373 [Flavobacterium nitrogenifigens]|uniref:TonB protein C-terminal n=2 Tax=Flavobacterium TaxID=237 RepID=A0A7W7ITR4_9FLAO|nr:MULTISPECIES: hypothetical protein [Flavobacterium]MBB4800334.1 hypothetical protein [Flavobacterium nitrogenifigens]MBB6385916.1 hypothetical protein [Flavobacterium notoginsengisoli]
MKHKITIPEPCHEDWNKMSPNENGRFCMSCSKTVVDFTSMLPEEIQHFFIQNKNEKICGRFKKSQLDSITIQIPNRVLYSQTHYRKIFLLALFVAMGTTLFSCQGKDGAKQKIEKVEITDESSQLDSPIGKARISKNDSTNEIPPPPPPPSRVHDNSTPSEKYKKMVSGEVILEDQNESNSKSKKEKKQQKSSADKIKTEGCTFSNNHELNINAEFPGGIDRFYNYFSKEFKKPENLESNNLKINLSFAVEKNGSVTYLESVPPIDKALENEIIRVLKLCPKWVPGQTDGKIAKKQYSVPIVLQ